MPTAEQLAFREELHRQWRRDIGPHDTRRFIPEARRRVRAIAWDLYYLGINPDSVLEAIERTVVERAPIDKAGYLIIDRVRQKYVIETNEDLFDLAELRLTRWHELAHLVCLVSGHGLRHGLVWKAVVRLLGFPEEARDFPDIDVE